MTSDPNTLLISLPCIISRSCTCVRRWHPAAPPGDERFAGQGDDLRGSGGGRSGGVSPRPRQSLGGAEQGRGRRLPAGLGARPRDQPAGSETPLEIQ